MLRIWHDLRRGQQVYVAFVSRHPIVLVPLAIAYVAAASFLLVPCVFTVYGLIYLFWGDLSPDQQFSIALPVGIVLVWGPIAILLALHYLYVTFVSFLSASQVGSFAEPVFRVLQLVATTSIFFAAIHYYVALLSDGSAYDGLVRPMPRDGWSPWTNWFDRLVFVPSVETVVDCLYFSAVTMATVGYGDIKPVTVIAKVAAMAEILFSFGLIVVVLGWVIGHAKNPDPSPSTALPGDDGTNR